jgi:hypothetical protein
VTEIRIQRAPMPADRFMIVANAFMRGQLPVPLKALPRVLLGHMLSLPDGWVLDRAQLDASVVEGRDAVSAALTQLEEAKYLARVRRAGEGGRWTWSWAITDDPLTRPLTVQPSTGSQGMAPTSGNSASSQVGPSTGKPSPEGQSISKKTEIKKTDEEDAAALASGALFEVPEQGREEAKEPKPPTINQRANVLAGRHYERLGKMGNVPAFAKIVKQALTAGWQDAAVDAAMAFIAENRWTLTAERLANTLKGGPKPASRPAPARPTNGAKRVGNQILEY